MRKNANLESTETLLSAESSVSVLVDFSKKPEKKIEFRLDFSFFPCYCIAKHYSATLLAHGRSKNEGVSS